MKNPIGLILVLASFGSVFVPTAQAHADATPSTWSIGGLGGLASPSSGSGASTRFQGGVVADYRIAPFVDLGAVSTLSSADANGAEFKTVFYGIESNYHIPALDGLAVGARLGFTSVTAGIPQISIGGITVGGEQTTTALSYGPHVTYDYKVAQQVSVGLDAGVNFVSSKEGMPSFSMINTLASVKYWF
jgi:hypothetical protein